MYLHIFQLDDVQYNKNIIDTLARNILPWQNPRSHQQLLRLIDHKLQKKLQTLKG